jgi:hypothetical protein
MSGFSPLWVSLREAARRFIREEDIVIWVDEKDVTTANGLVSFMVEKLPARLSLPVVAVNGHKGPKSISLLPIEIFSNNQLIARLSGPPPQTSTCWVPGDYAELWVVFVEHVEDLLDAGYPGCVGCAGPGAEGEWDEISQRAKFI